MCKYVVSNVLFITCLFFFSLVASSQVVVPQVNSDEAERVTIKNLKDISVKITNRPEERSWFSLKKYIGRHDSQLLRKQFITDLKSLLFQYGYTKTKVDFKVVDVETSVSYEVKIFVEKICTIKSIHLSFKNSSGILPLNSRGDVCDRGEIEDKISLFSRRLKDRGYKEASINFESLKYSDDNLSADLYISGGLGNHSVYKVFERKSSNLLNGLWGESPLQDLNYEYATDETVAFEIKKFYLERGFFDVLVDEPFKVKGVSDTIEVVFSVDPGFLYRVGSFRFRGNSNFSRQELLDQREGIALEEGSSIFNQTALDEYIKTLREFYFSNGFWDVKIKDHKSKNVFNYTVDFDIRIDEGRPYYLNSLKVSGNSALDLGTLELDKFLKVGHSVDPESINALRKHVLSKYRKESFLSPVLQIKLTQEQVSKRLSARELVNVHLQIEEGKKAKVSLIEIEGLKTMSNDFVLSFFDFKVGDFFTFEKVESTRRKLVKLGVFDKVHFAREESVPLDDSEFHPIVVRVKLQESLKGNLSFGPGYNLKRGFFYNFRVSYSNILGEAHKAQLGLGVSQEKNQPELKDLRREESKLGYSLAATYSIPALFKESLSSRSSLSQSEKASSDININTSSLWTKTREIKQSFDLDLNETLQGLKAFNYYHYLLNEEQGSSDEIGLLSVQESKFFLVGLGAIGDFRDSKALPQKGVFTRFAVEQAGLFDLGYYSYTKTDIALSYYLKLFENKVLALHFSNVAHLDISNFNNSDFDFLPRAQRIFLSGSDKLRGFKKEVGPYSRNIQSHRLEGLGGTRSLIFKLEFRLYKLFYSMAGLTFFLDGGNTFFSSKESHDITQFYATHGGNNYLVDDLYLMPSVGDLFTDPIDFFDRQYYGAGVALNLSLPLGVLNVSVALPVHQPPNSTWDRIRPNNPEKEQFFDRFQVSAHIGTRF